METRITDLGPCLKAIEVTIPEERIRQSLEKGYGELRGQIALPGFRPGKVPRAVLERKFGDQLRHQVLHELLDECVQEAITTNHLEPVSEPEVQGQDEGAASHRLPDSGPLVFTVNVEIKADFPLPEYKGIEAVRHHLPVAEAQIDDVLRSVAEKRAEFEPISDETWKDEDLVSGQITLRVDGEDVLTEEWVAFQAERPVLDAGVTMLDAVDTLKAARRGTTFEVRARITEDHERESWHGRTASGTFTWEESKRLATPAVDDALAAAAGFADLAAFREDVRKKLEVAHKAAAGQKALAAVIDKILASVEIPIAPGPVERMLGQRSAEEVYELRLTGMPEDEAIEKVKARASEIRAAVERDTRAWLLLERIAKKERIFCLEDDLDREFARIAVSEGVPPSQVRDLYEGRGLIRELKVRVLEQKTCEYLRTVSKFTDEGVDAPPLAAEGGAPS